MTFDMSQKLMRLANYFNIGMTIYEVQENGNIVRYILTLIQVEVLSNEMVTITFTCENKSTGIEEYFDYEDLDEGRLFISEPLASEQARKNTLEYYGGK